MQVDRADAAGEASRPASRLRSRPIWATVLIFLVAMYGMQWGWSRLRGTAIEHWVIDQATVSTAVSLIRLLTPDIAVHAQGPRIQAPGGGINVYNGCEGTELLFLMLAALLAHPMGLRWRLIGLGLGISAVFALNQIRLLALFYSFRADRQLFDQVHGLFAPLVLAMLVLAFVMWLIQADKRSRLST